MSRVNNLLSPSKMHHTILQYFNVLEYPILVMKVINGCHNLTLKAEFHIFKLDFFQLLFYLIKITLKNLLKSKTDKVSLSSPSSNFH